MADGIELATAYVRIVPTTEGIQGKITSAIEPEANKAGISSGTSLSNSFVGTAQKGFGKLGSTLGTVGKAVTTSVSAPITAAATASMAAWSKVDSGFDTVIQKTGATGKALKDMQDSVQNIATKMPVSFQDAGTAIGEVNTRFGITGKSLENLSTQFLQFAKINQTDVNSSIDNTQKVMSAFGLKANDASALLDKMNAVGQETGVSMDQLQSGLISNATALQDLGMNAGESVELVGKLSKTGVDTSVVMTGLSKVQKAALSDGVSMQDELKKALSSSDNAIDIFGSRAGAKLYKAFENGTLSADMFTASMTGGNGLNEALGSVTDTFEGMQDPADQWQTVLNNLMMLGYQIGQAMMPTITNVVQTLIPIIQQLCDAWNSLSPGMQNTIVKAALVAAAAGPVVSGFGKVSTGISSVLDLFSKTSDGTGLLGKAFETLSNGPVGIIVAAIAGVIAALIALYNNNESFRNFVNEAWTSIQSVIGNVITAIQGFWTSTLQPVFQAIGNFCKTILWPVVQVAFMAIGQVISVVFNLISGYWDNILKPVFTAIGTFIQTVLGPIFSTVFSAIQTVVSDVFSAISGFWNNILSPVFTAIGNAVESLKDAVSGPLNAIKSTFEKIFNGISDFLEPKIQWLKDIFNFKWDLPKIKLPHFSIDGKFSLDPPSVPHLEVDWYAKAMNQPYILDQATIFGTANGSLLGGGEAGREIIMSESYLRNLISDISSSDNSVSTGNRKNGFSYTQDITINSPKELSPSEVARQTRNSARQVILALNGI